MDPNKQTSETPPDPQVAPTPGQKVQYVVTQRSLNGLGGWLLFFLVIFALLAIGEVGIFFSGLDSGVKTTADTVAVVFAPLLAVGFLGSVVLMALRKKIAVLAVYISVALLALYSVVTQLIVSDAAGGSLALRASGIVVALIFYGLFALYFRQSRRVKETLIK